jgi:4,5-dihydroxyphthalate decarboxylase
MSKLALSVAVAPYEHALDVLTGRVRVEGIDLNWIRPSERIDARSGAFDVAEMPLADYVAGRAGNADRPIALPVFLRRAFVHDALRVASGSAIRSAADLAKPLRWATDDAMLAAYARGWIEFKGDCPLHATTALFDRLAAGDIDVAVTLAEPASRGASAVRRALPDDAGIATYEATKVFPILSVLCVRRALVERHPWLPACLYDGFMKAKDNSLHRLITAGMSRYAIPWINAYVARTRAVFGDDFWPYGVDANRPTLEAFLGAASPKALPAVDDLFAAL